MNERDAKQLITLKKELIENCTKCKGFNLHCDCYRQFWTEAHIIAAGIPIKYRKFTFKKISSPTLEKVKMQLKNYLKDIESNFEEGLGLYLYGSTGTAKTALASVVLIEAIKKGYRGKFTTLEECTPQFVREELDDILTVPFLVIDDVGKEMKTQASRKLLGMVLDTLIRKRSNNLLPTIATSNLNYPDIDIAFGDFGAGVVSLLHEHMTKILCRGVDYRKEVIDPRRKQKGDR